MAIKEDPAHPTSFIDGIAECRELDVDVLGEPRVRRRGVQHLVQVLRRRRSRSVSSLLLLLLFRLQANASIIHRHSQTSEIRSTSRYTTTPLAHITYLDVLVSLVPILSHATLIHGHGKASFFEANKGVGR